MKPLCALVLILLFASTVVAQDEFMVKSISFTGNRTFTGSDLRAVMLTKESPSAFSRFTYKIIRLGGPPEYLDLFVLRADLFRIKQFYKDHGFLFAQVDSSLSYDNTDRTVDINIKINEGPASYIRNISPIGLEDSSKEFMQQVNDRSVLRSGGRYSASDLELESNVLVSLLQNDGYAYAKRDSLYVSVLPDDSVDVDMYFHAGKRYRWGELEVLPLDSARIPNEKHIVVREMLFKTGDVYNAALDSLSEQRLYELNLFELAKIVIPGRPPEGDSLPAVVSLRSRPPHEITPELFVNDENNAFNFGGGLGYLHRNFFGDARLFSLNASIQLQNFGLVTFSSKVLSDTVTVGKIDATAELIQPYLFSNATSLTWDVSFLVDKEEPYLQLVARNKFRISERFAEYTTGYLDWDIERAKVDSLKAIPLPAGLEEPQFNSILTFALQRDKTDNRLFPTRGFFNSLTIEEAGVMPRLINDVFKHSDFPFAEYWKFTLYGRWYFPLNSTSTNVLAIKGNVGYAQEYGTSAQDSIGPIPLNHRFYAGGSGSIRGWRARQLGDIAEPEYGGNTLIETNFEDRFRIAGDFGGVAFVDAGNLWNSYRDITLGTIAVASGFGLRYNTFFGPLRVDFGFRVYDPSPPPGYKRFIVQQTGTQIFKQLVVSFGIEQAF